MADGTQYSLTDDEIRSASDALKAQEEERRAYRQQSWDMTQGSPDEAAEAMKLGDKYGVPRQAVEADPDFWRQRDADAQRRLMESASPKTMAWLDDEQNYSVGKDDIDIWGSIEGYFGDLARDPITTGVKTGSAIGGAAKAGWLSFQSTGADADREQLEKADRYYDELDAWKAREAERTAAGKGGFMGRLGFNTVDVGTLRLQLPGDTDPMPEPTARLIDEAFKKDREWWQTALGLPGKGYRENPREVVTAIKPLIQDKMDEAIRTSVAKNKAVDEAMPQTGDFLADSLLGGVRAITEMTPLIVSAIATRGKSVPTVVMGSQVYYNEYATGRERELGINKATERAVLQAGVEAVSERISLGMIDDMLKDKGSLVLRASKFIVKEQGQEQIATIGNRLVDWSYLEQGKTLDEFVAETPRSMLQTSITTLVASSGMQTTFLAVDYATKALINDSLMMQPSKADKKIDDLLNAVSKSKLRARSPEKAAALATQLAEGTGAETVVIDLDGLAQSLEAAGLDVMATMEELGVSSDALSSTAVFMGTAEIPTARLMVSEGIQTHRDKVQPHLRLKGEDLTPAQKETMSGEMNAYAKGTSEYIKELVASDADVASQKADVEESVATALRESGFSGQPTVIRANSVLMSNFAVYGAMQRAKETGEPVDVAAFWAENGPSIVGSFGADLQTDVLRQEDEAMLEQSIRTAVRMPMTEVNDWVKQNTETNIQTFQNGDESAVITFPLTDDPGAPPVMVGIRLSKKGRADVNLFLDNKMSDALDGVEDVAERSRAATEMFSRAVMVMRQYAAETPDLKAFTFTAAESQAEGTNPKSREALYRFLLSSMQFDGYTAYEIASQTSVVNTSDTGEKSANPLFPSAGFVLIRDGVDVNEFARNEILRGNQSGGGAGEVVTALSAVRLSDASGRRVGHGGSRVRAAGAGGVGQLQDDTLAQTILADPEVREAMDDPETDVLPLTDDMQVTELDEFLAFHGTLAKFDKFEMDKIGSGEGAQAFGPGHYFTQSRGVAEWYRKRMKKLAPGLRMGKEAFNKANPAHFAMTEYWRSRNKELYHELFGGWKSSVSDSPHSFAIKRAIRSLEYEIGQLTDPYWYPGGGVSEYATPQRPVIKDAEELIKFLEAGIAHLKSLDPDSTRGIPKPTKRALRGGGNIYTVAVKLPSEFTIQLDLPFGDQPAKVQAAFRASAEAGHLGDAAAALEKYGDETRMTVLVAALKAKDSPAMEVMRANGIKGVRYLDGLSRGKKNKANQTYNYVVFEDADVKIIDRTGFLFQSMDGVQQERRGGYSPSTRQIVFTEARDVSTFMHETAHWFLDTLEKLAPTEAWAAADLAEIEAWWAGVKDTPAMAAVRARYSVVPSGGGWQVLYQGQPMERPFASEAEAMARIEWRERQEAFAETFEQYLQTGKAPTPKLVEVFRAFRDWLVNLYKGMAPREREALNPAIQAVFDRVLAVDTEVDAASAEAFRDADTMAKDMLAKGVITERQYRMVGERLNKAREEVKEEMIARALKEEMRTREDWWAKERQRVKGDLARAFDKSEVGRVFNWLAYGEWKGDVAEDGEVAPERADALSDAELFQFAGVRAIGADLSQLERAKELKRQGVGRDEIWSQTGWNEKVDGNWRFEISDAGAKLTGVKSGRLEDVLEHDALYAAYPGLRDAIVENDSNVALANISIEEGPIVIRINWNRAERQDGSALVSLMHEIQHGIQKLEDWTNGFSPDAVTLDAQDAVHKVRKQIEPERLEFVPWWTPVDLYNRVNGEVEARATQKRLEMTAEERRSTPPEKSEDIPRDRQIKNPALLSAVNQQRNKVLALLAGKPSSIPLDYTADDLFALSDDSLAQTRTFNPPGHGPVAPPPDVPPVRLDLKIVRDLYGEEAVKKLPAAVRRRSSTSSNVTDMLAMIETVRKTLAKKRKGPQTLTQFIMAKKRTNQDGTKEDIPWGIKGAADELKAMGLGKLINEKSGRTLDYVREAAEEAGFIRPRAIDADLNREASDLDTTTNDLLEALAREAKGEAVVRIGEEGDTKEAEDARVWADWLSQNGVDIYEADKKVLKASVEAMLSQTDESLISPDQAAELFGFPNGEELLNALAQVGNRDKFLNEQADRKMAEEFGDMMKDGTLIEEAREAARLDILGRQSEIELEALSRAVGQQASANYAKQMARDIIALRTVKEIAAYERDLDNERRFSKQALSAVAKGDYAAALKAKQRQIIAAQMYREGKKAHERIEKQRKDLLKYLTSEGRRDKIDAGYLEKIEDILDAFELRVSKQGPAVQRERTSAAKYVAEMDAAGREDEVAPEARLLAELAAKTTWRNLTGAEVEYLVGTVSNLAHLGRTKDSLIRAQEKRKFRGVIDSLTDRMNQTGKLPGVTRERSPSKTAAEMLVDTLREGHSWLMRPEHQARSLDGGELGPIWDAIFRPMAEAADVESRMMREATELYRAAWSKFSMAERNAMSKRTVSVPELPAIGKRFTRLDLISIALNWGVPYNREVLLEGYGWTADQVEAALFRTLDDSHWDLVESIWAISGMYKAEAFAVEKDMTGVEPKSVEGISFTLPSGRKIEGKYYHIQYDASQPGKMSRRQAKDNDAEALSSHRKSRTKAMTKNGGLIERKGSGGRKVKLGLSVFEKALSETVHDIAFRRAVYDVGRIVADDQFADMYQDVAGMEAYRQLNVWLKDVAMPPMEVLDPIVKAFAHVRRNIPLAVMGYKVGTALIQPTGLLAAMPIVGHRRVAFAVAKAFANPKGSIYATWKQVAAMSEFMADRVAGYERDVRETTTAMTKGGPLDFMRRNAFVFITGIDIAVSVPTWMAAYGKAMDGKVKGIDVGVEEDAIAYADSIIRRTQTAGKTQDLSRFQRGGEFQKQISMIFGYFNNLYSLSAQQTLDMRRGNLSRAEWAWHMSILFVAIPLLAEVFAGRLFPDDDDDEATLEGNIAMTIISNFTGMFPGIRDAVSVNIKPEFGYRMSPTAKFVEDAAKTAGLPAQMLLDEERELTEADVKRAVNTVGAITGLPSAQINITGDYIVDALEGSEDPMADPADAAREAFVRNSR